MTGQATTPLVKVCGITRLADARVALDCGAAALGFVFYPPSPRKIAPEAAAELIAQLPPFVTTVGVFVNETADEMNRIARLCRLDRLQLHGEEPHALLAALERPAYRAFRPRSDAEAAALDGEPDGTLLLDTFQEGLYGGTGRSFDWAWAARMARRRRVILAGGLTADNVGAAVAAVRPYGLDVSSSMEAAPGIKDPARITAFFQALAELPGRTSPQGATHASAT